MASWKRENGASLVAQKLVLPKGSYATYQLLLDDNTPEQAVSARYRLEVTYEYTYEKSPASCDAFFHTSVLRTDQYPDTRVSVQIQPRLGEDLLIKRYFECSGGSMTSMHFRVENLHSDVPYEISKIELFPSYDLDDTTLEEVDKLIPAIQHVENTKAIRVYQESTNLIDVQIEAASDTNLLMHFMLNFKYSSTKRADIAGLNTTGTAGDEVTLTFKLNESELNYSPITYTLVDGYNLIALPLNIMNVSSGVHKFKVDIITTGNDFYIEQYKLQLTLDGKNLISRSGSSAPSVFEQVYIAPIKKMSGIVISDSTDVKHVEVVRLGVRQTIQVPRNKPLGYLASLVNITSTSVADQIDFKQGLGAALEQYSGSKILYTSGDTLGLKPSNIASTAFTFGETFPAGDYFYLDLDNTDVLKYVDIRIDPMLIAIDSLILPITEEQWVSDKPGYRFKGTSLLMDKDHIRTLENSLVLEEHEMKCYEVLFDEDNFTEILQIQ